MTDNSHALKRSRRQDSQTKRRKATEALRAMIDAGEPISFPAVARRAGVSISLPYADKELAARLSGARSHQRDAGQHRAVRLPVRSLVSDQSLRADLANAKDQIRRLHQELTVLRDRLARQLGSEASGRVTQSLLDRFEQQAADLQAANAQLRQRISELENALRESSETLEAARAMNRELMAEINRPVQPEDRPEPTARRSTRSQRGLPPSRPSRSGV